MNIYKKIYRAVSSNPFVAFLVVALLPVMYSIMFVPRSSRSSSTAPIVGGSLHFFGIMTYGLAPVREPGVGDNIKLHFPKV